MRALLVLAPILALLAAPAVAETGRQLFDDNCADCHALTPTAGATAPPLAGVVGRKIASVPGFAYSDALKAKGGVWTEARLEAFLADPQSFAPGTAMYGGAPDPAERKAIIDYLKTAK